MERRPGGPARFLKTRHYIVAALVAATVALAITGFAWAKKGVTIVVDGRERLNSTKADDVRTLLTEAGVRVADGDVVAPPLAAEVSDGMKVTVRHAVPVVLRVGGQAMTLRVVGSTVADALVAAGMGPDSDVHTTPSADKPLVSGMTITAADAFLRVEKEERKVPFETRIVRDPNLPRTVRKVIKSGRQGKLLRVYEVVVSDGREGARMLRLERVVAKPVAQVVAVGDKREVLVASRGDSRGEVSSAERERPATGDGRKLRMTSSAYAPGYGCGTRTATGAKAGRGIAAVDPAVIPLGTRLYVPGYGYAVAADTGAAIKGARIDLCFDTVAEARAWGMRSVTVVVLR